MNYQIRDFINKLADPRKGQGQRHKLEDIILIVLLSFFSGHQGLKGMARFAKSNASELTEVLHLKHGVPKYNTFRDVLNGWSADLLTSNFIIWMQQYHPSLGDELVSLDGKAVRATVGGGNTALQNFIAVVSAFGHQSEMVYGMQAYENAKSAESQALRDLVTKLGFTDTIFTMDALHTQKNTWPNSQPKLPLFSTNKAKLSEIMEKIGFICRTLPAYFDWWILWRCSWQPSIQTDSIIYDNTDNIADLPKGWNGILRLVKVRRWGFRNHEPFDETAYYALSKPLNSALIVGAAVQAHWGIENKLHRFKDVNLGEDVMTLKNKNAVTILVALNNLSLNLLKANGLKPIKDTYAKIANKVYELAKFFNNS